ncbi:TPA: hypothetical protein U2M59_000743 [Providencia stuartii]|nr:hypothetical protein [Providencia stuartii]
MIDNNIVSVSSISELQKENGYNDKCVYVQSYYPGGEKGGGIFKYNSDKNLMHDGGVIIAANDGGFWVRQNIIELNFDMFGADPEGIKNSRNEIQKCFQAAHRLGVKVNHHYGKYILSDGASRLEIKVDCDLAGTTFIPKNWSGQIYITRDEQWEVFSRDDDVIKDIDSSGLTKGVSRFKGWENRDEMSDCFIQYDVEQPMYKYRSNIIKRQDYNRVFYKGQLASPLLYNLDSSLISKLKRLYYASSYITIKGLTIDESNYTNTSLVLVANATKVNLLNVTFFNRGKPKKINVTRLEVRDSSLIYIDKVHCSDVNATTDNTYTYTLSIVRSYDVECCRMTSDGFGWGSTGSNNSQRVTFRDCQLSRVDFHNPAYEWLKIINCTIGNWGVLVTMAGDLHLIDCEFLQRDGHNNSGFIRSRSDTGGWCDGNLYISNCKIVGKAGPSNLDKIGFLHCQTDSAQGYVEGSPINFVFFNSVLIDGMVIDDSYNHAIKLIESTGKTIPMAKSININNYQAGLYPLRIDFTKFKTIDNVIDSVFKNNASVQVSINNSNIDVIDVIGQEKSHLPVFYINNVKGKNIYNKGVLLNLVYRGRYYISNSEIRKIRNYSGEWALNPTYIKVSGGKLGTFDSVPIDTNGEHYIEVNNTDVLMKSWANPSDNITALSKAKYKSCNLISENSSQGIKNVYITPDIQKKSVSLSLDSAAIKDNWLMITYGYDSKNTVGVAYFKVDIANGKTKKMTPNGEILIEWIKNADITQVNITSSGENEPIRRLQLCQS